MRPRKTPNSTTPQRRSLRTRSLHMPNKRPCLPQRPGPRGPLEACLDPRGDHGGQTRATDLPISPETSDHGSAKEV
eukprot:1428248-Pyramimonas_sp.AAC.1